MRFEEFKSSIIHKNKKGKVFNIRNSKGLRDAYRWASKNKLILMNEQQFTSIVKTLNNELINILLREWSISFPYLLGELIITKDKRRIVENKGNYQLNTCVDWQSTLKLWFNDKESYKNKTLVRFEVPYTYSVFYSKRNARYKRKKCWLFKPHVSIKKLMKKLINNNNLDGYELHLY